MSFPSKCFMISLTIRYAQVAYILDMLVKLDGSLVDQLWVHSGNFEYAPSENNSLARPLAIATIARATVGKNFGKL